MFAQVMSYGLEGMDGYPVTVEVNCAGGVPRFSLVGLPDAAVKEANERVRAAVRNSGMRYPVGNILVNLAPANIKKNGSMYDLPIAIGILIASGYIDAEAAGGMLFVGELALDGSIRQTPGALTGALFARERGCRALVIPEENAQEVRCVDRVAIIPARTLADVADHLHGARRIEPVTPVPYESLRGASPPDKDIRYVRGQHEAKRALEIAAAGGHNLLMVGPPGSGKTMLAECMPGILPDMTFEEALESTRVYSAAGRIKSGESMLTRRPFRAPHHTASAASLVGGGKDASPGEISFAHNGILFLDELPEYDTRVLEALRQPLENGEVSVARVRAQHAYPARVMLVAAMNPCKCGYYGTPGGRCACSPKAVAAYQGRVSGPLLDRIDLRVTVKPVPVDALAGHDGRAEESSAVRARVNAARARQVSRGKAYGVHSNAQLDGRMLGEVCRLEAEPQRILSLATEKFRLSARSHYRVLRVARTIADLAGEGAISVSHVSEALAYRLADASGAAS